MSAWADPHKGNGWIPSHRGEYIYEFGMDEAKAFLQSNGLKGIFRGHEQVQKGHTSMVYDGYYVTTVFSAADYVGTFCRGQEPPWMFGAAGEGNSGAFVLVDLTDGTVTHQAMSGSKTRALAAQFTGAKCHGSWLETGSHQSRSIESFMQENHKRLAHGNTSCTLDQTEVDSFKEEVRKILSTSKDQASQEFEARKLIDLQGEALTHGESIEICRSMKKDHITLEVYNELRGTDEEILENDIKVREIELEESDVDT
ncbi:unnamed protein product [Durusdinium trenchii]|uniref:Protein-serine/threonine phosphatase n=1 Tax=Durusdinium trenchii TaxID=1381693 RepID=A0ABP0T215_9DINO